MKREGSAAEQANLGIIQIAFSRSNAQLTSGADGVEIGGRVLYGGISKDITQLANLTLDTHFGDVYHVYSAKWTDTSVQFAVDGQTYGQYDISKTDAFLHQEVLYMLQICCTFLLSALLIIPFISSTAPLSVGHWRRRGGILSGRLTHRPRTHGETVAKRRPESGMAFRPEQARLAANLECVG